MVVAVWQADKDPGKSTCKVGWQRQFPSKVSQLLGCKTMQDLCFKLLQDSAFCKYLLSLERSPIGFCMFLLQAFSANSPLTRLVGFLDVSCFLLHVEAPVAREHGPCQSSCCRRHRNNCLLLCVSISPEKISDQSFRLCDTCVTLVCVCVNVEMCLRT